MQDNEHQQHQHQDEASTSLSSSIVRVDPLSPHANDDFALSPVVLPSGPARLSIHRVRAYLQDHAQLCIGLGLGAVATLFLGPFNDSSAPAATFQNLNLSRAKTLQNPFFELLDKTSEPVPVTLAVPPALPVVSPPQWVPQLQAIDRFYFTKGTQASPGHQVHPTWYMVDRFYFGPPETISNSIPTGQGQNFPSNPIPVPQTFPSGGIPLQTYGAASGELFQGRLEVPPPPDFMLASGASTAALDADSSAVSPLRNFPTQGPHTLLGVVATNQFSAALVKTNGSSYSVRIGQSLRQSGYQLVGLEHDKAILTDGQRNFVISVGEQF